MKGRPRPSVWLSRLAANHPSLAPASADHYAGAAYVCLTRFHDVPPAKMTVRGWSAKGSRTRLYDLIWRHPTAAERRTHANEEDGTEAGAYAVALAAVHRHQEMVTIGRSESRTGSDWYLAPSSVAAGADFDLDDERVVRFEVSGVSNDDPTKMRERVARKVAQARAGVSAKPAVVGVVGFRSVTVVLRKV